MNFEHLFDKKNNRRPCEADQGNGCYWIPTGNIRSMIGDNVNVSLYCKNVLRSLTNAIAIICFLKSDELHL